MSYFNFEEIGNGKNYVLLRLILSGSSSCTESQIRHFGHSEVTTNM